MGPIAERSKVTLDVIKRYLGLSTETDCHGDVEEDRDLKAMLVEAKDLADEYCDNSFIDAAGREAPIPPRVDRWVKSTVARWYQLRENGKQSEAIPGVGDSTWGPVDYTGLPWKPYV